MAMLIKIALLMSMAFPLAAQTISPQIAAHARTAREAEQRGDFSTAVREYQTIAKALPQSAEIQSNLGVALYFDHQLPKAIDVFRRAIALNPKLPAPHLFSGLAWYRLSNPDAAVPELEKAVRLSPSDGNAHTWLGYSYAAQGNNDAAVKEFQSASQIDSNNIDLWYALGKTWLEIGKDATRKLLEVAPKGGRVWQLAGEQCQLRGETQTALEDFEQANALRPDIPELRALIVKMGGTPKDPEGSPPAEDLNKKTQEDKFYRRAHTAEQESRAAFEHVVEVAPDSYRAHQIAADAFATSRQNEEAIKEYRTVLQLKPDLPGIHESIGEILIRNGNLLEALKEFEAEIQLEPLSASPYMNAGRVLLMMNKDEDAEKMLASALKMNRPPLEAYLLQGKVNLRKNDYKTAISLLTYYISKEKNNSTAYYLLAMSYRGIGDKERMKSAVELSKMTSLDAKERSRAQKELEPSDNHAGEEP